MAALARSPSRTGSATKGLIAPALTHAEIERPRALLEAHTRQEVESFTLTAARPRRLPREAALSLRFPHGG
jgi:hypothetical protein